MGIHGIHGGIHGIHVSHAPIRDRGYTGIHPTRRMYPVYPRSGGYVTERENFSGFVNSPGCER